MKAIDAVRGHYWAILPESLQSIQEIANRDNASIEAVAAKLGRPLENTQKTQIRDKVAIIPVTGPIFPRANMLTAVSGATSISMLATDITEAANNPDVDQIVLDVDSPGGVAIGPSELTDVIKVARQKKPVIAYIGGICASAAYWIASAADKIIMHRSAMVGSIGVVVGASKQETTDRDGYRHLEIVSTNAQNKRVDPAAEEGRAKIIAELDGIENEFISDIAANRGVSNEYVIAHFGQGAMSMAKQAVAVKMADGIATFEELLAGLAENKASLNFVKGEHMKTEEKEGTDIAPQDNKATSSEVKADDTPKAETIDLEAIKAQAAAEERERLFAIDAVAFPGHEALVEAAKKDPSMTAEKLSFEIVKAEKAKGESFVSGMVQQSAAQTADVQPSIDSHEGEEFYATPEEKAEAQWRKSEDLRTEFPDMQSYIAFEKANANGQIKIMGT